MTFSIWNYAFYSAFIPVILAVVGYIVAGFFARKIALVKNKFIVLSLPLILWGVLFIAWLYYGIIVTEGCTYPLTLVFESKAPVHTTVGEVSNISNAPSPPKYYNKSTHSFETAKFIEVNGIQYYVLSADLEEGDLVKIKWMTVENVVLSYEEITAEEYAASEKPPYPALEEDFHAPPLVIAEETMKVGATIRNVCLTVFVLVIVAVQYIFAHKITKFLEERDRNVCGEVKANGYGGTLAAVLFGCVLGAVIGTVIMGFREALPIVIVAFTAGAIILLKKQTTKLELHGDVLTYSSLFKKKHYKISDISKIIWKPYRWEKRGLFNNRKLQITFQATLTVTLEQESYWGLENMYNDILKAQSNMKI